jgi:hypothetical protein
VGFARNAPNIVTKIAQCVAAALRPSSITSASSSFGTSDDGCKMGNGGGGNYGEYEITHRIGAVNGHASYRPPFNLDDAIRFFYSFGSLALLSIHCMRAVLAAEDGHHLAAAEQEQVSSCPAPSSSAVALQAAVEQLLHEVSNLRRDMQELKAASARPAPGTIVDTSWSKLPGGGSCPSDQHWYIFLCVVGI